MKFRFLDTGFRSAAENMALDESILLHRRRGEAPPTLRFYGWSPPAVSIGYFQSLHEVLNLEKCSSLGIEYVRRMTGGGAVFHEKELTYSLIDLEKSRWVPANIKESYKIICKGIVEGLSELGVHAEFFPLNDVVIGERKISGNAQTRRKGVLLQHGTILLDANVEKMFGVLRIPQEKLRDKAIKHAEERITSLKHVLSREVAFDEVVPVFRDGFERALGAEMVLGELSSSEERLAHKLAESKYTSSFWNDRK